MKKAILKLLQVPSVVTLLISFISVMSFTENNNYKKSFLCLIIFVISIIILLCYQNIKVDEDIEKEMVKEKEKEKAKENKERARKSEIRNYLFHEDALMRRNSKKTA